VPFYLGFAGEKIPQDIRAKGEFLTNPRFFRRLRRVASTQETMQGTVVGRLKTSKFFVARSLIIE
jgi:hypothetical protein